MWLSCWRENIRSFFCLKPKKNPFRGQEKAEAWVVQGYCSAGGGGKSPNGAVQ